MTNKLPLNWCECKLEDFCYITLGQSPNSETYNDTGIGIPFFQGKADFTDVYPIIKHYCSNPTKIVEKDFVLLSVRAPVGTVNISPCRCCIGRGLAGILGYKKISTLFIFYLLKYKENDLHKKETGTTFKAITGDRLKTLSINLPPLAEQGRIVERIEEMFEKIDAGVEKLKSAQEKIKQYKQSVLHSAFTGKLYKTTEWKELPLNDVCKIILGQSPDSQTYNDDGIGLPFFQGKADFTNMYPIVKHYCSQFSKIAEINDILLSVRAPVGAVNISNCKCCIGRGLAALREIKDVSLYKFIYYLIKFKENELHKRETGTTFKAITGDRLKTVPISLPTLSEQERIVEEIEKRFAKADKMLEVVEKSLKSAEQLKQSVLKKAFEGKLVPQDPNDEPASVLLDRIKSEKQQNEKAKGKKK